MTVLRKAAVSGSSAPVAGQSPVPEREQDELARRPRR
jgi:hypothetical protein